MKNSADVMNSLEFLQLLCAQLAPDDHAFAGEPRHAAVCVLVAEVARVPSICFIRRAQWDGDPWSEHIALPGGSRMGDESLVETVRREVREEIGVAIADDADLLPLPRLKIRLAGRERLLLLDAFVHHCTGAPPSLRPGPEVASAFWIPLAELWNSRNLDHLALRDNADTLVYPAVRIPQGMIFGITLRVLTLLSDRLGMPLHYLEEIPLLRRKRDAS
jgi:8-oxo-dGTP pyrophosphatase MutT (NUDIX family)